MKQLVPTLIALLTTAGTALSAGPDFRVELFSGRRVASLMIQATRHDVELCGSKGSGPCLVLRPAQKAICSVGSTIRCQAEDANRKFTHLTASSLGSFRLAPDPTGTSEPLHAYQTRNARVTTSGAALRVITEIDLESYVSGVLSGEASSFQTPAARAAMAILARTWALRWRGRHHAQGFDFCSLTHCQAYRLPQGSGVDLGIDPAAQIGRAHV